MTALPVPIDTPTEHCSDAASSAAPLQGRRRRMPRLVVHYLGMVVAMAVGMVALQPIWFLLLGLAGWSALLDVTEVRTMVMATNMTIAMTAWMRFRNHSWTSCAAMGAAMYLPFIALFVPMWLGLLSASGVFLWGHVLMLVAMAGAMAVRPHEYAQC